MRFQLSGMVNDSIVDGPGLRLAVFMQGCPYRCPGCHNPQTHDVSGGQTADTQDVLAKLKSNPLLDGLTLSGGEPLVQPQAAAVMAEQARGLGLNVWCYTGSTFEEIIKTKDEAVNRLLSLLSVLVDGPFIEAQKSLDVAWRGSSNQRLIDVPASLKQGKTVLWQPESR